MKNFYTNNDHDFNRKLKQHEFQFMENAWEDMERRLEGRPKPRPWLPWLKALGLGLGLCSLSVIGYLAYEHSNPKPKTEDSIKSPNQAHAESKAPLAWQKSEKKDEVQRQQAALNRRDSMAELADAANEQGKDSVLEGLRTEAEHKQKAKRRWEKNRADFLTKPKEGLGDFERKALNPSTKPIFAEPLESMVGEEPIRPVLAALPSFAPGPLDEESLGDIQEPDFSIEKPKAFNPHEFSLSLGFSAKKFQGFSAYSFSPTIGAFYKYRFNGRHQVLAGLQYKALNALEGRLTEMPEAHFARVQAYPVWDNMDSKVQFYHNFSALHLLELPVLYQYQVNEHWSIGAGLRTAYLLGLSMMDKESVDVKVADLGLQRLDLGMLWSLQYQFSKHLSLNVQAGWGLLNLSRQSEQRLAPPTKPSKPGSEPALSSLNAEAKPESLFMDVLVKEDEFRQDFVRTPQQWRNSDLQFNLRYTF